MPKLSAAMPKYRRHSNGKHAIVTLSGKTHYLGHFGSPDSKREYDRLIAEWLLIGRQPVRPHETQTISVVEMAAAFQRHAKQYYRKHGKPTREVGCIVEALRLMCELYGRQPVHDFGPLALKAVREQMIQKDWSRGYINKQISRITRAFRWAASEELIPADAPHALAMVAGLKKGRTRAFDRPPVQIVDDETINQTLPHLPRVVADRVRFQRLTGSRPGEICSLKPCHIHSKGEVWSYHVADHKNQHHNQSRIIPIGPRAQDILRPYLSDPQRFCFSPAKSEADRRAKANSQRKTPASCGNRPGSNRKPSPKRKAGESYTTNSYRRAIHHACQQAGVDKWSPNRLRHTAATEIREQYGIEAAQVVLGHKTANITEVYAERNDRLARQIARELG
ncbi:MAG: site-specific integrase [Pirellulaceae bacterium]|nr:site-specific integrase [Pirellulaceae bacterium]